MPCTAVGQHELTTPSGPVALSVVREEIRVHGTHPQVLEVKSAAAGVLLRADEAQESVLAVEYLRKRAGLAGVAGVGGGFGRGSEGGHGRARPRERTLPGGL